MHTTQRSDVLFFSCTIISSFPHSATSPHSGPVRLERYNETLVNRLLEVLKPEPVDYSAATPLFTVIAKDFEKSATEKEKWYGTPYQASCGGRGGTIRSIFAFPVFDAAHFARA